MAGFAQVTVLLHFLVCMIGLQNDPLGCPPATMMGHHHSKGLIDRRHGSWKAAGLSSFTWS